MALSNRDRRAVEIVSAYGVLRSSHIRAVLFAGLTDKPYQRCLTRLVNDRFLARVGQRDIGYTGGGSSGYAYQLGINGWKMLGRDGRYYPKLAAPKHTLAIADCMVNLYEAGILVPDSFEPEAHRVINGVRLDPDAFYVVERGGRRSGYLLEVDVASERMATSHKRQLLDKMRRYWGAACAGDEAFPWVVFAAPDPYRLAYIRRLIHSLPPEQRPLFKAEFIHRISTASV